jgi:NAD(P)-dependent dehydrogenase (short-subunit alcohol dehydrogenase family)
VKRLGEPSEVAATVALPSSDAASYITGEIVVVDGGRMTLNYTVPVYPAARQAHFTCSLP